jgi:hypothetical protein
MPREKRPNAIRFIKSPAPGFVARESPKEASRKSIERAVSKVGRAFV